MKIAARIDSSIHIDPKELSEDLLEEILGRLTVANPAKEVAKREMLWGEKDVPEHISLYKYNGHNELVLPRGFVHEFEKIVGDVSWDNQIPALPWVHHSDQVVDLRAYQYSALGHLYHYCSGIYKAPTGSGKTRVMLELVRQAKHKTIIFCEKSDIAYQWVRAAEEIAAFKSVGKIWEGVWEDEKNLVVALRQSVYSKDLDQEWYDQFGVVVVDECHHCSADTMFELVQKFPAYYRYGCSATPDSDSEIFPIARAVLGPVVVESTPEEIGEHLVKPSVKVVKTKFMFPYRPTERKGKKVIRNNYKDMMWALEQDRDRNTLIVEHILNEIWGADSVGQALIVSKRKKHLEELIKIFLVKAPTIFNGPIQTLTGDNSDTIQKVSDRIENNGYEGSVLFSTLADEGTDIPRLDRVFLCYPGRKLRGFEQAIGRIMRPHPKKKDAVIYDFRDFYVPILNSQYRDRSQRIYAKRGYEVAQL